MKFTRGLAEMLVATLAAPARACAWGYEGRKIIAAMARSYLSPGRPGGDLGGQQGCGSGFPIQREILHHRRGYAA
jgi:hypothetical protein